MKLTNTDRDAFVSAVMKDLPKIDYETQVREHVLAAAVKKLPKAIQEIWADAKLRGYIRCTKYVSLPTPFGYVYTPEFDGDAKQLLPKNIEKLCVAANAQFEKEHELRRKVRVIIQSCSTLKKAQELLPEFIEYLPKDRGATGVKNLPVISNVVAELSAAGWPKGKSASKNASKGESA